MDHLRNASLLICTDSQSLLAALAKGPILQTGDIENEIWNLLLQLASAMYALHLSSYTDTVDGVAQKSTMPSPCRPTRLTLRTEMPMVSPRRVCSQRGNLLTHCLRRHNDLGLTRAEFATRIGMSASDMERSQRIADRHRRDSAPQQDGRFLCPAVGTCSRTFSTRAWLTRHIPRTPATTAFGDGRGPTCTSPARTIPGPY